MGNVEELSLFLECQNDETIEVPKLVSVFQKFRFESPEKIHSKSESDLTNPSKSSVCSFLEKVQAIFIDEISGAPVTDNSKGTSSNESYCLKRFEL